MSSQNPLKDTRFKSYITALTEDVTYDSVNSDYYTETEFNAKHGCISEQNVDISIFHVNVRSLNANQSKLVQLLLSLNLKFDMIVLSEIWSFNIQFYNNILDGYSLYFDLPNKSNIGGIGVFMRSNLSYTLRNDLNLITNDDNYKLENLWFDITKNGKQYLVGSIYRHPNQSISEFKDCLDKKLKLINRKSIPCIILGDINIDFLKHESL